MSKRRLLVTVNDEFEQQLQALARTEEGWPSQAEMIRRIVARAYENMLKKQQRREKRHGEGV